MSLQYDTDQYLSKIVGYYIFNALLRLTTLLRAIYYVNFRYV